MKKIVALVLSLAMAMSLCSAAFAIDLWTTNGTTQVDIYEAAENTKVATATNMTFYAAKNPVIKDGHVAKNGNIAYYEAEDGALAGVRFVKVPSIPATGDVSDYYIVKGAATTESGAYVEDNQNSKNATYYMKAVDAVYYGYSASVFTAWSDNCLGYAEPDDTDDFDYYSCAQFKDDNGMDKKVAAAANAIDVPANVVGVDARRAVVEVGAVNVKVDATTVVTLDLTVDFDNNRYAYGVLVADRFVDWTRHNWTESKWDEDGVATHFNCTECKDEGKVINSPVNNPKGNWIDKIGAVDGDKGILVSYFPKTGATGGSAASGQGSPATFDAGIAMYVGMSLMAVAGSAAVIGKKKEF